MIQKKLPCFNLKQIAGSGQCFRMIPHGTAYSVISGDRFLLVSQDADMISFSCTEEEFPFWESYFDLQTDYQAFINAIHPDDAYLKKAAAYGSGIRILRQDPWEMIITFIISQQKTIPSIRALVEALSTRYGAKHAIPSDLTETFFLHTGRKSETSSGSIPEIMHYHTFPTPEQLSFATLEDLLSLKLGYRAKYIKRICEDACSGALDLSLLSSMDYRSAMEYLVKFYGIGEKVANCICLFGLHHIDAFPVDTWIRKILLREYAPKSSQIENIPQTKLCDYLIHENFSRYQGYAGIMQQYIFYYERAVVKGRPVLSDSTGNP